MYSSSEANLVPAFPQGQVVVAPFGVVPCQPVLIPGAGTSSVLAVEVMSQTCFPVLKLDRSPIVKFPLIHKCSYYT